MLRHQMRGSSRDQLMCNPNSFHRRQLSGEARSHRDDLEMYSEVISAGRAGTQERRDHTEMYSEVISAGRAGNRERQSEVIREAIRGSSEGPSV
jgi:hypothetical protein